MNLVRSRFSLWENTVELCQCINSDPGSRLRSARNASVKITKLFVKSQKNSFKHESESSSKSIFFMGEYS